MKSFNIVVCASGGGGNFRSLINHQSSYDYHISLLIVDRECKAINVANENNIPCIVLEKKFLGDSFFEEFAKAIPPDTNLIVLAGFFPIIPQCICDKWERKIINTHPSLLPEYGGKGMYGVKVQEAVLKNREKYAGCTVHYVNAGIDTGEIIFQKRIYVQENESAWELGGRVFNEEIKLLPLAVKKIREEQLRFALDAVSDMKPSPLVSICCLTYNHAPYLRQCLDGFMMQGGDPKGNGTGGSGETIKGEFSSNGVDIDISHTRGTISMARSTDPDSASSQFFIVQSDSTFLDGDYAAFGHVTEGMDIVDKICKEAKPTDDNGSIKADEQPVIESIRMTD